MKTRTWIGWAVTGSMAALMLLSAAPDVLRLPEAMTVFRRPGYPPYLLVFLGTAKILGVAAVLAPGIPRVKEWAFAGLAFDLCGALYSHLSVGDPPSVWMAAVIGLVLMAGSYIAYRTRTSRADASQHRRIYLEPTAATGTRRSSQTRYISRRSTCTLTTAAVALERHWSCESASGRLARGMNRLRSQRSATCRGTCRSNPAWPRPVPSGCHETSEQVEWGEQ